MKRFDLLATGLLATLAVGALLRGPLRAQETAPPPADAGEQRSSEESAQPAKPPAGPQEPASREPPPAPEAEATPAPDEGLSADNSLSFPVDI